MRSLARALVAISLLAGWPMPALAAPPIVTGIEAEYENGQVTVRWDAIADNYNISAYRIYYSRASILQNGGEYEDFETVTGKNTEFILTDFPRARTLYVSVLAVDANQEESTYFAEEARVELESAPASQIETPADDSLRLLRAEGLSATGVLLVFSATPHTDESDVANVFQVIDASGTVLPLVRYDVFETRVVLTTDPQEPGKPYAVLVAPTVYGKAANGQRVEIDPAASNAFFTGSDGTRGSVQTSTNASLPDVSRLQLRADNEGNGLYTVTASWDPPEDGARVGGYRVGVTRDGGATFTETQTIPSDSRSIRFGGVLWGNFAVRVQTVGLDDSVSQGIDASAILKPIIPRDSTVPSGAGDGLTKSGAGAASALILSGAAAGWLVMRRRTRAA